MKKYNLLMVSLFSLTCFSVFAQPCGQHLAPPGTCTDTVPAEAVVVGSELSVTIAISQCYWVCEGATLSISSIESGNNNIDMEANSTLNFSGSESTIWAKEGCTINIGACFAIISIHMEADVDVNFDGGGALCIVMDTCANVTFNYDEAPSAGCAVAIDDDAITNSMFSIYPNPATDLIQLQLPGITFSETVFELRDMQGKIVYTLPVKYAVKNNIQIHLPELPAGMYAASFAGAVKLVMLE